jgi:hemerythrin superfamily protein
MALKGLTAAAAKAIRRTGAAVKREPGLIGRLKREHAEVATLMTAVLANKDATDIADVRERQRVFDLIHEKLTAHTKGEESVVYPSFEHADGADLIEDVEHSYDDHHRIETLLEQLYIDDVGTAAWMRKFEQMHDIVVAHVNEEEHVVFPQAFASLTDEQFRALDARYLTVETEVKQQIVTEREHLHR